MFNRGTIGLGFIHTVDNFGELGRVSQGGRLYFEGPFVIDGACEYDVAGSLVYGDRLACDGGLIEGAVAFCDAAIERNAFAGKNAQGRAEGDVLYGCFYFLGAVTVCGSYPAGLLRGEFEEALDGVVGPCHGPGFEHEGDGEEKGDHSGLEEIAQEDGSEDSDGDKEVDVGLAEFYGDPGFG